MITTAPHYLLFSEASQVTERRAGYVAGRWRFVLESIDGDTLMDVEDEEEEDRDRLELLAVVRGLESLDRPSRVTLISAGQYIRHGFLRGLPAWREGGWMWERFGERVPIKNRDLWERVDRALRFHAVNCRSWRFDDSHNTSSEIRPWRRASVQRVEQSLLRRIRAGYELLAARIGKWFPTLNAAGG